MVLFSDTVIPLVFEGLSMTGHANLHCKAMWVAKPWRGKAQASYKCESFTGVLVSVDAVHVCDIVEDFQIFY